MSFQDELNRIARTTVTRSIHDCMCILAGDSTNLLTTREASNSYAGVALKSTQEAINAKAGTTGLSKQDAAELIPTP